MYLENGRHLCILIEQDYFENSRKTPQCVFHGVFLRMPSPVSPPVLNRFLHLWMLAAFCGYWSEQYTEVEGGSKSFRGFCADRFHEQLPQTWSHTGGFVTELCPLLPAF